MDPIWGRWKCIAWMLVDGEPRDTLILRRYPVAERSRPAPLPERPLPVPPPQKPKPAPFVALKGKALEPVVADLRATYGAAREAWYLGRHRRRALDAFDEWLRKPRYTTEETFPAVLRMYEKRTMKMRRWFGEQSFATNIELQAYLTSECEDWSRPFNEEEQWLRVWIYLCGLRQVGRLKALAIAGKKPDSYLKNLERRGGPRGREEAALQAAIADERIQIERLERDREYWHSDSYAPPAQEEAEARLVRIGGVRFMVTDIRQWREKLPERGATEPLWRELISLRERRIMVALENIERSIAPRLWSELATYP